MKRNEVWNRVCADHARKAAIEAGVRLSFDAPVYSGGALRSVLAGLGKQG